MWEDAKPKRNVPSKSGSQTAIGHAQLSLHSCQDSPRSHLSINLSPAWPGLERRLGTQKMGSRVLGLLSNADAQLCKGEFLSFVFSSGDHLEEVMVKEK